MAGPPLVCNDNNACTDDACNPSTGCFYINDNTNTCTDNSVCTSDDHCINGSCVGAAITCPEDDDICTTAACNPISGCYFFYNNTSCNDNNLCTINDHCSNGVCVGTTLPCSDGNICTNDFCNPSDGQCYHVNNSAACTDGNLCTTNDFCSNGVCMAGPPLVCNDNNACTDDACNPTTGCFYVNDNTNTCTDNSVCTSNDHCFNGSCTGDLISCPEDNDICTTAACHPVTGCYQAYNTASCNDNNACTENDHCVNGNCTGSPKNCNDNNVCTDDFCDPIDGHCFYINNTASCSDGNLCTTNDFCSNGFCMAGPPIVCNDNNACTDDACNPTTGCFYVNDNTNTCTDNSVCTSNDHCFNGSCTGDLISCPEDNDICTTAACHPVTGCYQAYNTAPCSDGNLCTANDHCVNGICIGSSINCNDGNVCTDDFCDPVDGHCFYINNTASCSDGNLCTTDDFCFNGFCMAGSPVVCNDNNACTDDACNPTTGCFYVNDNTNTCTDNSVCTSNDHCINGSCIGSSINCNDGNVCTTDLCDANTGNCYYVYNTASCSDGNLCTTNDFCSGGVCVAGPPLVCNDNNPCTDDACNAFTGCVFVNDNSNLCTDNNPCTTDLCSNGVCISTPITKRTVTSGIDNTPNCLRDIIAQSCSNDTIVFAVDTSFVTSEISLPHNLHIEGNGPIMTVISGTNTTRIFRIPSATILHIRNLSLIDAFRSNFGGAFLNSGTTKMRNLIFKNNYQGSTPKAFTNVGIIEIQATGSVIVLE